MRMAEERRRGMLLRCGCRNAGAKARRAGWATSAVVTMLVGIARYSAMPSASATKPIVASRFGMGSFCPRRAARACVGQAHHFDKGFLPAERGALEKLLHPWRTRGQWRNVGNAAAAFAWAAAACTNRPAVVVTRSSLGYYTTACVFDPSERVPYRLLPFHEALALAADARTDRARLVRHRRPRRPRRRRTRRRGPPAPARTLHTGLRHAANGQQGPRARGRAIRLD